MDPRNSEFSYAADFAKRKGSGERNGCSFISLLVVLGIVALAALLYWGVVQIVSLVTS